MPSSCSAHAELNVIEYKLNQEHPGAFQIMYRMELCKTLEQLFSVFPFIRFDSSIFVGTNLCQILVFHSFKFQI